MQCCCCHWLVCTCLASQPFSVSLQIPPGPAVSPCMGSTHTVAQWLHPSSQLSLSLELWLLWLPEVQAFLSCQCVRNYCSYIYNSTDYHFHLFNPLVFQVKRGIIVNQKTSEAWVDPWNPKVKFFSSLFFRFGLCLSLAFFATPNKPVAFDAESMLCWAALSWCVYMRGIIANCCWLKKSSLSISFFSWYTGCNWKEFVEAVNVYKLSNWLLCWYSVG